MPWDKDFMGIAFMNFSLDTWFVDTGISLPSYLHSHLLKIPPPTLRRVSYHIIRRPPQVQT